MRECLEESHCRTNPTYPMVSMIHTTVGNDVSPIRYGVSIVGIQED